MRFSLSGAGILALASILVLFASLDAPAAVAGSETDAEPVDFARDVRPILSGRCFKCHGPAVQEGGLRLDSLETAAKRKGIVPGKPEQSRMIAKITTEDEDDRMPPFEAGDRLSADEIAILKRWIAEGARYAPHWAFQPIRKDQPFPSVRDESWPRNGIDRFILARLEREGLAPSPAAEKATQIRRVHLDLLGVLPSPADVEAFLNDSSPDAYERVVDRLLESPRYGERQARHWLDLARYADSNGYTIDGPRSIWPYRDWVIRAFNRDLPFDQFTIEQLAGDLLPDAARDQKIATGFHRNTSFNEEGGTDPEQFRVERTVDRTNVTGSVWLGLTVGCAQCHDHKYDPLSQKEYYQLYAFLNSADEPMLSLPNAEQERKLKDLQTKLIEAKTAPPPMPMPTAKPERSPKEIADELREETGGGWAVLEPIELKSDEGATLKTLEDKSVLASGPMTETDTYTIMTKMPSGTISAIRLEALTHPSLPSGGPGRASHGNFVMSHFVMQVDGTLIPFKRADADHSQPSYDVADALKGDPAKGWAINLAPGQKGRLNVDRQAVFVPETPVPFMEGRTLVFRIKFSRQPKGYTLGRLRLSSISASERFLELPVVAQNVVLKDPAQRSDQDWDKLRLSKLKAANVVERLQKEIKELEAKLQTTLVMSERPQPRTTHIQIRGDFLNPGAQVEPGAPAFLPPIAPSQAGKPLNRLDLARWLVRSDHPLTPRVFVNRVWQQYFGKGLAETEGDFGMQGALPSHPELLDWLAAEWLRQGWSVKRLHRLIVTSAAYRQSSAHRADIAAKDPNLTLLGQMPRLRLEAEIIRDAALSASGLLSGKIGGPGVFPPQPPEVFSFTQSRRAWTASEGEDRYRRGMYTYLWRQSQHPLLTTFDAPDAQTACTRRNRSNTPLQALHLANDPVFVELAQGLAKRIEREGPSNDSGRLDYAFRLCFARSPHDRERERLLSFLQDQRKHDPDAAWAMTARVLLNLDEFITRE